MQDGVQAAGRGWPWGDGKALHPLRSGAELATTLSRHVLHYKPALFTEFGQSGCVRLKAL